MNNLGVVGVLVGGIALGGTLGFAAGTRGGGGASKTSLPAEPLTCSASGPSAPAQTGLVEVAGKTYTQEELPADLQSSIFEANHEAHEKSVWSLKEFAMRMLLAQEKGIKTEGGKVPSLQELVPVAKPDEGTVKAFYEANKAQIPPGTSFEQVKPQIEQHLARQALGSAVQAKMAEFEKAGKMKVLLKEPVPPVVALDLDGFPSQGPKDAAVTLVEASDYLCPHCQHVQPEVESVLKEHAGKIRFVQVNFSLNPEGLSGMLAQGAFCAQKRSLEDFWKYHHVAFGTKQGAPADARKETLAVAAKAGVGGDAFEKCLGSDEAKAFVAKAVEKMTAVGVSGTPTFFLNGRKLGNAALKESVVAALEGGK